MKYKVIERISYNGKIYDTGEEVEVLEMYVSNLKKRGLIQDVKGTKTEVDEVVEEVETVETVETVEGENVEKGTEPSQTELTEADLSKLNKDKLIEVADSKGVEVSEELTKKEIIKLILGD